MRLDLFLVATGVARTRSQAKAWIDAGRVRVGGKVRKAGFGVDGGERIEVDPPPEPALAVEAEDLPLTILHQDEDLLAIDKPAGMVVHPAPGSWRGTVVNALLHRQLVSAAPSDERPGIVHRLDKETSGVLLVARTPRAHEALARAFHDRMVKKTYLAIVLGVPRRRTGSVEWAIGRHPRNRKRMSVRSPRGRSARTDYAVIETFAGVSLVRVEPETGRTHQIRVHLAALGHPVLADPLYGARRGRAYPPRGPARSFARQALHAAEIAFRHPVSGEEMHLTAPLPADMSDLLSALRAEKGKRGHSDFPDPGVS